MKLSVIIFFLLSINYVSAQQIYNVQDFGAKNDGKTVNTLSIQQTIDHCSSAGGGRVVFNSGIFLSGTLYLKSNVELYLGAGAVLKGVADMAQYTAVPTGKRSALINAFEQDNIAILGPGKIDGSGDNKVFQSGDQFNGLAGRPHLVHFQKCNRVRMKEFTAVNSAFWTLKIEECSLATIDDIRVTSRVVANNDGLDIVDCHNVTVSNSFFDCGDDGICPKSDGKMGVKNLVITNCIIKSESNGIKFGTTGVGGFEDVTVSNCVIYDTRLSGLAFEMVDGGTMNRIVVNNITMHRVNGGIFIKLGQRSGSKPGILKNITISNVIADGIVYHNGVVAFVQTEEGSAIPSGGTYKYEYDLKDHLGNVRVSFAKNSSTGLAEVIQEDEYYAFGLRSPKYDNSNGNRYLYNGKEIQTDLANQYDYGARFYDPVIGRFTTIDPMAEDFDHMSPYNYAVNNPILMIDPDGMPADTTGSGALAPPLILPGIELKEVIITAARTLANNAKAGLSYLASGATVGGIATFFGAMLLPNNYQQNWQYRDYGLPELPPPYIPINTDKDKDKETAGSGTPRKKATSQLRKEWEKGEGKAWPKEPDDPTRNQAAHHKVPLADGGYDGYPNIEPLPRREHVDLHRNNGDSARWGRRRN